MQTSSISKFRFFPLLIGYLLFSHLSFAQFTGVGIETGPGARILFGNEALQQSQQLALGFSFGVNSEYRFNPRISLRSGIYYELKGGQTGVITYYEPNDPIVINRGQAQKIQFRSRDNFNFITIPILFKVSLGKERHWYLNAGASVGYLMRVRDVTLIRDGETRRNKPYSDHYFIEYSALFGIGYERTLNTKWKGHLELRNHLGLNNLLNEPIIVGNGSLKTNSCYLLAGLTYRLPSSGNW